LQYNQVVSVRALELDNVAGPPRIASPELKGGKRRENVVVEKTAQAARIVTADLKSLTNLVAGAAFAFDAQYFGDDFLADTRIFRHLEFPLMIVDDFSRDGCQTMFKQ
jgi:hypothetical protein